MQDDVLTRFLTMPAALRIPILGNVILFAANIVWSLSLMGTKIDPGLATLLGASFGFAVVGWQANRGFRNLIRSQANQAELDRQARMHKAELEEGSKEKEWAREKQLLLSGIRAEMVSLYSDAKTAAQTHHQFALIYKAMHENGVPPNMKEMVMHGYKAPFYNEHIGRLGLLGVSLAADVIKVYSRAYDDRKVVWERAAPNSVVCVAYATGAILAYKFQTDLYHVAMRIRAHEEGTQDPGTVAETEAQRHANLPKLEDMVPAKMI